jgi:hypothetical protein
MMKILTITQKTKNNFLYPSSLYYIISLFFESIIKFNKIQNSFLTYIEDNTLFILFIKCFHLI